MKLKSGKFLTATGTVLISMCALCNAWAYDRAQNLAPIFGDFHASLGEEVVIPFLKPNDLAPVDGYMESVSVSFKVFTAGTNTLLHQTQPIKILTPALPTGCAPLDAANNLDLEIFTTRRGAQLDSNVLFRPANKRMAIAINMDTVCYSSTAQAPLDARSGFVYSADLSGTEAGGSPGIAWYKSWENRIVEGLNGVDVDNDLVNDFLMITTGWPAANGWNLMIGYANSKTGAINTTIGTSAGNSYTLPTSGKAYLVLP